MELTIWTMTIDHKHGIGTTVHATEDAAWAQLREQFVGDELWAPEHVGGITVTEDTPIDVLTAYLANGYNEATFYGPEAVAIDVPKPRIELVVTRDPDSADEVDIYIDGVPVEDTDIEVEAFHIDAGAGYSWDDWVDSRASDVAQASPAVAELLRGLALDPPGDEYVEDMPDDDEQARQFDEAVERYRALYAKQAACSHPAEARKADWRGMLCGDCGKQVPWLPHPFKQREGTPHSYCDTCHHSEEGGNHE